MARKQLIKGANAARVEARISRVPADLGAASGEAPSIFGALKAMEEGAKAAKPTSAVAAPPAPAPKPAKRPAKAKAESPAKPKAASRAPTAPDKPERAPDIIPLAPAPPPQPKPGRIGPSDFTAVEREAILRCCRDYRNHLPTYLLAVQKEVKIIDSVIAKCGGEPSDK
jgi:hypothetical protein